MLFNRGTRFRACYCCFCTQIRLLTIRDGTCERDALTCWVAFRCAASVSVVTSPLVLLSAPRPDLSIICFRRGAAVCILLLLIGQKCV